MCVATGDGGAVAPSRSATELHFSNYYQMRVSARRKCTITNCVCGCWRIHNNNIIFALASNKARFFIPHPLLRLRRVEGGQVKKLLC